MENAEWRIGTGNRDLISNGGEAVERNLKINKSLFLWGRDKELSYLRFLTFVRNEKQVSVISQ